jgi:transcriptional regulator with XRE-family HTH domain
MRDFGRRLRELRIEAGWTQRELAGRAGLDHNSVSRLEKGDRTDPPLSVVVRLAEALGADWNDLLGEPRPP